MREGWPGDDYLVLLEESEIAAESEHYELSRFLLGFKVPGLRSWDDFIVQDLSSSHLSGNPTYQESGLSIPGSMVGVNETVS
jgi:hypothetical protein